jgi:LacI family transcriptional regulator
MAGDFTAEGGYQAGVVFAARVNRHTPAAQRCTAVFCANDRMAAGLNACLNELGWCLPQDLSLVGYDDDALAPYATPALTTVHVPIGRMAECAAAMVLNICYDMHLPVQRHFEPHLVWRASLQQGPFEAISAVPPAVTDIGHTHFIDETPATQPRRGPTLQSRKETIS